MDAIPITETREPSLANRLGGRVAIVFRDKRFLICGMALVGILLSSCGLTLMNEKKCLAADWDRIGLQDGSEGYPFDRFDRRRTDCAEYGIVPDLDQYQAARQRGLEQVYCTKRKGIEVGRGYRTYKHVCPANLEPDFLDGLRQGQEIWALTDELRDLENEIEEVEERLEDPNLSAESREILTDHLSDLSREAGRLENQLETLEENL